MIVNKYSSAVLCVSIAIASISIERTGWIDRLVQYHKNRLYNDILLAAPLEIKATIERAPAGYVDSPLWNINSVMHLLILISESESCVTTRNTLRRMLRPTRRIMMSKQKSYKLFPSLSKNIHNIMYYDLGSDGDYDDEIPEQFTGVPDDDAVVVVSNPVEARLPSAQISVKLLSVNVPRDILEARAQAGRVMPPTTRSPIPWKPMNASTVEATTMGGSDNNGTEAGGGAPADTGTGAESTAPGTQANAAAATTSPAAAP